MGVVASLVIVIFGVFTPFLTIVLMPPRAVYLVYKAHPLSKIISVVVLVSWAYYVLPIVKQGYASLNGPTVDPRYWIMIGAGWFIAEIIHGAAGKKR